MRNDGDTAQADHPSPVASIAAHRDRRRRTRPAPAGPAPADLAGLQAVLPDLDAGTLAAAPEIPPQPDGSDILRRLERATARNGVIARLGEVMARITADDPATAAFWASLTGTGPATGIE